MNANKILSNCNKEYCHNDDVDKNILLYICNAKAPVSQSLSLAAQLLSCSSIDQRPQSEKLPKCSFRDTFYVMGKYDKHSVQSFHRIGHILCTFIVVLVAITLARVAVRCGASEGKSAHFQIWLRYVLEFIVIMVPTIACANIANQYVELIVLFAFAILILYMWRKKCWQLVVKRYCEFGQKPALFTLIRATINITTAVCILAIDFESFPKDFRKTRYYGVGLMDVGIGIFVFSMGIVAPRPRKISDLRKLIFTVGCLFLLGLARTLTIAAIDYHQDEHEYGKHLNAFFTLGFTKLFATCFGFLTKNNNHLVVLGLVILLSHEAVLQYGVSKYVMDPDVPRTNFFNANREGLCSIPGFIAIYLLSQYVAKWLCAKETLDFEQMKRKLKILILTDFILWLLVILAIFVIGIARVTCNLGYALWILATALTILTIYFFVFYMVLGTSTDINKETSKTIFLETASLSPEIPEIVNAINFNGLTFFLIANILTGCANLFLATDEKTNLESVFILFIYMLTTTTLIFLLYRYKIKIA